MQFFLTLNRDDSVGSCPFLDKGNPDSIVLTYLLAPLSYATIQAVQEQLHRRDPLRFWHKASKQFETKHRIVKILEGFGWNASELTWQEDNPALNLAQGLPQEAGKDYEVEAEVEVEAQVATEEATEEAATKAFNQLTLGRQLSLGDLRRLAHQLNIEEDDLKKIAHRNVEQGRAKWVPAVRSIGQGWQCQRCGERDVEEWPSQYGRAATCRSCESIGSNTSLNVLYRDERSLLVGPEEVVFQPHWALTEAQSLASDEVFEFINDPCTETALLWAACGAGKTEVCFPSAAWALKQGKTVLFAAPRQDVIKDVAPRIQRDFPNYPFQVLTGTSTVKFQDGGVVLATTHQVLKFWRAFDLIFMENQ